MLLDSWQEHDLLECATKAAPGNAGESPRQRHRKSIPPQEYKNTLFFNNLLKNVLNLFYNLIKKHNEK
jgi:hypothetical protein